MRTKYWAKIKDASGSTTKVHVVEGLAADVIHIDNMKIRSGETVAVFDAPKKALGHAKNGREPEAQIELHDADVSFPDVTKIIIGTNVKSISIRNDQFSNVQEVIADSYGLEGFVGGPCLMKKNDYGEKKLLNTF